MPFPNPGPARTLVGLEGDVLNQILFLLRDDQKLDFMWRIWNCLTDSAKSPYVIIFYGPGGEEEKSALATNINRVLGKGIQCTFTILTAKNSKQASL